MILKVHYASFCDPVVKLILDLPRCYWL